MKGSAAGQKIFLVRHGQREDFENPAWSESAVRPHDTPLSATGFRQVQDVARALIGQDVGALYSSPFLRALQTADVIAAALDLPIRVESGICEWWNPAWMSTAPRLMPAEEIQAAFPRVDGSYAPVVHPVFPESDETVEVRARVGRFLNFIVKQTPGEHVVIVSHGSPIGQLIGLMTPGAPGIQMQVASITRIDRAGTAFRVVHSGIDHLRERIEDVRFH